MKQPTRRGVTLIELLIALTITMGLGAAIISLLMAQTRLEERTESQRIARLVGRSAINVLVNTLRPVDPSWGIESLSPASITVKAPYAMGVLCASTLSSQTITVLPVDSVEFTRGGYSGFAARTAGGGYITVEGGSVAVSATIPMACTTAGIIPIPAPATALNQKSRVIVVSIPGGALVSPLPVGTIVMLYRRVTFSFGNSSQAGLSGRNALWRDYPDDAQPATELVAPFDDGAAFRFFVAGSAAASPTAPADLTDLRGFEFFLPGESEHTSRRQSDPEQANVTTAVYFLNTSP